MKKLLLSATLLLMAGMAHAFDRVYVVNPVKLSTSTLVPIVYSSCTYQDPVVVNATASGDTVIISSPGAGVRLQVMRLTVSNTDSANVLFSFAGGAGGTARGKAEIASEGGAYAWSFVPRGWRLASNTNLIATLGGASNVWVNVDYCIDP